MPDITIILAAILLLLPVAGLLAFAGCTLVRSPLVSPRTVTIMPDNPEPWPGERITFNATVSPAVGPDILDWTLDGAPASMGTPTLEFDAPRAITGSSDRTLGVQVRATALWDTTTIRLRPPDGIEIEPTTVTLRPGELPPQLRVFGRRGSERREIAPSEATWSNAARGLFIAPSRLNPADSSQVTVTAAWSGLSATATIRLSGWPVLRINCGGGVDASGDAGVNWVAERDLTGAGFMETNYSVEPLRGAQGTRQDGGAAIPFLQLRSCRYGTEFIYRFSGFRTGVRYRARLSFLDFISGAAGPYYGNVFLTDAARMDAATNTRPEDATLLTADVMGIAPGPGGRFSLRFLPDDTVANLALSTQSRSRPSSQANQGESVPMPEVGGRNANVTVTESGGARAPIMIVPTSDVGTPLTPPIVRDLGIVPPVTPRPDGSFEIRFTVVDRINAVALVNAIQMEFV